MTSPQRQIQRIHCSTDWGSRSWSLSSFSSQSSSPLSRAAWSWRTGRRRPWCPSSSASCIPESQLLTEVRNVKSANNKSWQQINERRTGSKFFIIVIYQNHVGHDWLISGPSWRQFVLIFGDNAHDHHHCHCDANNDDFGWRGNLKVGKIAGGGTESICLSSSFIVVVIIIIIIIIKYCHHHCYCEDHHAASITSSMIMIRKGSGKKVGKREEMCLPSQQLPEYWWHQHYLSAFPFHFSNRPQCWKRKTWAKENWGWTRISIIWMVPNIRQSVQKTWVIKRPFRCWGRIGGRSRCRRGTAHPPCCSPRPSTQRRSAPGRPWTAGF